MKIVWDLEGSVQSLLVQINLLGWPTKKNEFKTYYSSFHQNHLHNHYLCHRASSLGYTGNYHKWSRMQSRKWVLGWGSSAHHCHPNNLCACHSASWQGCTLLHGHRWMLKRHRNYLQQKQSGHEVICFYGLLKAQFFFYLNGSIMTNKEKYASHCTGITTIIIIISWYLFSFSKCFVFSLLIPIRTKWGICNYLHFTDEKTECVRDLGIFPRFKF